MTLDWREIPGWFGENEAALLQDLARALRPNGTIVEIGSYRGRSTVALAQATADNGAIVWSIDPHYVHEAGGYQFGPADHVALLRNVLDAGVAQRVRLVEITAFGASLGWEVQDHPPSIDLLFIDGDHEYIYANNDFRRWSEMTKDDGFVALHDSTGAWDGPTRVVQEALASGQWVVHATADYTTVLKRKA